MDTWPAGPPEGRGPMQIVYSSCAGLDVHKKTVVACRIQADGSNRPRREVKTFGTMTCDLLRLIDCLQ